MHSAAFYMQVDAEGSEVKIFDPQSATDFMELADVRAIQMEWQWMLLGRIPSEEVESMLHFFSHHKYSVHAIEANLPKLSTTDWHRWPGDVMFIKEM
jgi:hypothetical protein